MIDTDISHIPRRDYFFQREDFCIYSIVNLDNGKRYIGRSKNPYQRIKAHLDALKYRRHPNKIMNKDSDCRFGYEILKDGVTYDERNQEYEYMRLFRTNDERYGYNILDPFFTRTNHRDKRKKQNED